MLVFLLASCTCAGPPPAPVIPSFCPVKQPKIDDLEKYALIDVAALTSATKAEVAAKYPSWLPFQLVGCDDDVDVLERAAYDAYLTALAEPTVTLSTMLIPDNGSWDIAAHGAALDPTTVLRMQEWQDKVGLTALAGSVSGVGSSVILLDAGLPGGHPLISPAEWHQSCFLAGACGPGDADTCIALVGVPNECARCKGDAECIHGTAMSGVVTGVVPTTVLPGTVGTVPFAPRASKFAVRAMGIEKNGTPDAIDSNVIRALKWVEKQAKIGALFGPRAVLYLGFASSPDYARAVCGTTHPIATKLKEIRAHGVRIVAPAGNNSSIDTVSAPACFDGVISVAASGEADPHLPAHWSNGQSNADILAPGEAVAGGASISVADGNVPGTMVATDYVWSFGTSIAAAQVTGALALLGERMLPKDWNAMSDAEMVNCISAGAITKAGTRITACGQPTYAGRPALDLSGLKP